MYENRPDKLKYRLKMQKALDRPGVFYLEKSKIEFLAIKE